MKVRDKAEEDSRKPAEMCDPRSEVTLGRQNSPASFVKHVRGSLQGGIDCASSLHLPTFKAFKIIQLARMAAACADAGPELEIRIVLPISLLHEHHPHVPRIPEIRLLRWTMWILFYDMFIHRSFSTRRVHEPA